MSKKNALDKKDLQKFLKNLILFGSSALLVFLTALQSGVPMDQALIALYTWALSTVIDFLKKFVQETPK